MSLFVSDCLVCRSLITGIPSSHLHRLIISDDVLTKFDLLMMSTVMLETCREIKWINTWKSASSWLFARTKEELLVTGAECTSRWLPEDESRIWAKHCDYWLRTGTEDNVQSNVSETVNKSTCCPTQNFAKMGEGGVRIVLSTDTEKSSDEMWIKKHGPRQSLVW